MSMSITTSMPPPTLKPILGQTRADDCLAAGIDWRVGPIRVSIRHYYQN